LELAVFTRSGECGHVASGFFNASKSPCVDIRVSGVARQCKDPAGTEFEAVVDTGFAGFISMPMAQALPLGLVLCGQIDVVLADGSGRDRYIAVGNATCSGKARSGEIVLEPNSEELLVGMKFLRAFGLALVVTKSDVLLFEDNESWLEKLQSTTGTVGTREPSPPPYGRRIHSQRPPRSFGEPPFVRY
jgi:predicted aspartyl protease